MIRHKFHAKPSEADGFRFDSKLERNYYRYLHDRQQRGDIVFFLRQVPFHLPGGVTYRADFLVFYADGLVRVIDVKGIDTPQSKQKRKQVEALYPVQIDIVKKIPPLGVKDEECMSPS